MPLTITVRPDGPYRITSDPGAFVLLDESGKEIPLPPTTKPTYALCRCGASTTKPFCDGTHSRLGFRAAEAAREEFDATVRADQAAAGGTLPPGAAPPPPG